MNQIATQGIILSRVNYGEADRILTVITPDHGVISVIAKGVRKSKSKLAGGIELFSVSDITFIIGRGEIATLISTRLKKHYANISANLERTMMAYDVLKLIKKITRERSEPEYFDLLNQALDSLNTNKLPDQAVMAWFYARCLWIEGHAPNLASDTKQKPLSPSQTYNFNYESMAFEPSSNGAFNATHIKLLRIAMAKSPNMLSKVIIDDKRLKQVLQLLESIQNYRS